MKKEIVTVTCDYEGCFAADATEVRFSAFGGDYAIDLCQLHHDTLVELMRPYAESGRRVKRVNLHVAPKRKDMPPKELAAEPTKAKRNRHKAKEVETPIAE